MWIGDIIFIFLLHWNQGLMLASQVLYHLSYAPIMGNKILKDHHSICTLSLTNHHYEVYDCMLKFTITQLANIYWAQIILCASDSEEKQIICFLVLFY
jgi:hypothetical protein